LFIWFYPEESIALYEVGVKFGCWLLVLGSWLLVVGCWLLVPGSWFLVAGCWLS